MMVVFQIFLALCFIKLCESTNASYFDITACYANTSFFHMEKKKPSVVDVTAGSAVHIWCHFCNGKEDYYPKLWLYKPRGNDTLKEIPTEIESDYFSTKISITPIHLLNIRDFDVNYSGIYVCKSPESIKNGKIFIYILEGVINVNVSPKVGTSTQWQEYKLNYIDPINEKFSISEEEPFKSVRNKFNRTFKITTIWENWSECKEIDHHKGVRKRLGKCRLQASVINTTIERRSIDTHFNSAATSYLTDGLDIPCRSLLLNKTAPGISQILRFIPDYEAEDSCRILKRTAKHKLNKDKYKHRMMQAAENSHVTLFCSEIIPNSDLKWFKEEKLLNSLFRNNIICKNEEEPHISVDTNNSLHILHISKNEEGNYSCLVNGKKIQEFEVRVVSKSKLLNQEFIRYSIYLGFVLSLTMTCYCAGVCVAWHRRTSFVDPLNLNKKEIHDLHSLKCEREKLLN